jgi:hypothetical protein
MLAGVLVPPDESSVLKVSGAGVAVGGAVLVFVGAGVAVAG